MITGSRLGNVVMHLTQEQKNKNTQNSAPSEDEESKQNQAYFLKLSHDLELLRNLSCSPLVSASSERS